jgi:hypothetical protein
MSIAAMPPAVRRLIGGLSGGFGLSSNIFGFDFSFSRCRAGQYLEQWPTTIVNAEPSLTEDFL